MCLTVVGEGENKHLYMMHKMHMKYKNKARQLTMRGVKLTEMGPYIANLAWGLS